ncbi:thioredoxin domain-containing protein [Catenovulum agarivorans DS-2]|uniref:Thioredoxin domain-containing protein n=1 Tax=Catenovulum agarivorans DS-2 TaxID=1328313 RepID=W7QDR4_9ALTE|nr:tetratricopeptide repeat protein [Catenovulum agarivorans]EWH10056.1 thioredoxin domain-containing protein [Catenovulum agarivorans DS-2]
MDSFGQAPAGNNVVEITAENFQQEILQGSQQKLVVIDFYAQQSPESISLSEKLVKLFSAYPDSVTLARVNCEDQQMQALAMQFGVQAIPTVIIFKDGQGVSGFAGDKEVAELEQLFAEHLPKPEDGLLTQVNELINQQNFNDALPLAKEASTLAPERGDIKKALIHVLLAVGQNQQAESLLAEIGMIDQDDYYQSLLSQLELNKQAAETPEIQALRAKLQQDPEDHVSRINLAVQLHQAQQNEQALELLMAVLTQDLNAQDGEMKKTLMDILATMPKGDAAASKARRTLYSLLY